MRTRIFPALFAALCVFTGCLDQNSQLPAEPEFQSQQEASFDSQQLSASSSILSDSLLTVTIMGPKKFTRPGSADYVLNGLNVNGDYYVWWLADRCFDDGYCQYGATAGGGWGMDTLRFYADANLDWATLTVQIYDEAGFTGGGRSTSIIGPSKFASGTPSWSFCDGTANWYPFSGHYPGTTTPGNYYRNPCDGSRVWQ